MKKKFKEFEIQEEVRISQDDHELILEKGDKIQVLKEERPLIEPYIITHFFNGDFELAFESLTNFIQEKDKDMLSRWIRRIQYLK